MKSFVEVDLFLELIQGRVLLLDRPLVLLQAVDLLLGQLATVVEEVVHELSPETKKLMGRSLMTTCNLGQFVTPALRFLVPLVH